MAIDERSRHELYDRLEALLGTEPATTLMSHLPPVGWADVATKTDLDALRVATKSDIEALRVATKSDLDLLRMATKSDLDALRADLMGQMMNQTRTMIIALVTVVLAMASLGLVRG